MRVLEDYYGPLQSATTPNDLLPMVMSHGRTLGFDLVAAWTTVPHPGKRFWGAYKIISNYPANWLSQCTEDRFINRDPGIAYMADCTSPLLWDRDFYERHNCLDLWDAYRPYGFQSGICINIREKTGASYKIGFSRDGALPSDLRSRSQLVWQLQQFGSFMQEGMGRLMMPAARIQDEASLTDRQIECLRWTADGKTAWEIGRIIGVSARTVEFHLQGGIKALGSNNKFGAVVEALRRGLIA